MVRCCKCGDLLDKRQLKRVHIVEPCDTEPIMILFLCVSCGEDLNKWFGCACVAVD